MVAQTKLDAHNASGEARDIDPEPILVERKLQDALPDSATCRAPGKESTGVGEGRSGSRLWMDL